MPGAAEPARSLELSQLGGAPCRSVSHSTLLHGLRFTSTAAAIAALTCGASSETPAGRAQLPYDHA